MSERTEFRGVGEVHKRQPIAAVVEVARRAPGLPGTPEEGKWRFVRPFTSIPEGAEYAFNVLQSVTTTTVQRGSIKAPARELHPQFAAFNQCAPVMARTLRAKFVAWHEKDAWQNYLGTYQSANGKEKIPGWWCRGDAHTAERWDAQTEKFKKIPCPGENCEFQQPNFGYKKDQALCKPNLKIWAQFNWPDLSDGRQNPMPKVLFQLDSKSWNNIANIQGMFSQIFDIAAPMGYKLGEFPVFNLQFTMNLKERVKGNKKYPEISFSIDGDVMDWMGKIRVIQQQTPFRPVLAGAGMPMLPDGATEEDMERASEVALSPTYKPANIREIDQ